METFDDHPLQEVPVALTCANCGISIEVEGGKSQICNSCRTHFIKYPIPKWIKAFGIGLLLIFLFSLFSLSKNIETGIHFKRGEVAYEKGNFLTAEKEFQFVAEKEPAYIENQCHLLIAAYHNHDYSAVTRVFLKIKDKKIEENSLYNEASDVITQTTAYIPSDSLFALIDQYKTNIDSVPGNILRNYIEKNTSDQYAIAIYASRLIDEKKYNAADSLVNLLIASDPTQYNALSLKLPIKRELLQFDSSNYYADKMLTLNHEDVYAIASKARTLLKQKKDDDALQLSKKCYTIDDQNTYTLATLALVYHFKNDKANRDKFIAQVAKDTSAESTLTYVKDVIAGKEKFRN